MRVAFSVFFYALFTFVLMPQASPAQGPTSSDAYALRFALDGPAWQPHLLGQGADANESTVDVRVDMSKILAKACRHFRIIRLAHADKLNDEVDRFREFVYPRALNIALSEEIARLRRRQLDLREKIDRGTVFGPHDR